MLVVGKSVQHCRLKLSIPTEGQYICAETFLRTYVCMKYLPNADPDHQDYSTANIILAKSAAGRGSAYVISLHAIWLVCSVP